MSSLYSVLQIVTQTDTTTLKLNKHSSNTAL